MTDKKREIELPKIRESIKMMIKHGCSPFSILVAHGRFVTPDEAELLEKTEKLVNNERNIYEQNN